jgi:NADH:ubiquinone oxidoreductase subunit F (NADH-binding)
MLAESVHLLGRGGAGFPVAEKLRALPRLGARTVIANGMESEPASSKDRLLMRRCPHLVWDGLVLVARAVRARNALVVTHDAESERSLRAALAERSDRVRVRVVRTVGRFVAGEATAVIRSAEGKAALPTGRRIPPTRRGMSAQPTYLSNIETFAQLAVLGRLRQHYADTGLREEPGTTLLTVSGSVARKGVVEAPLGLPLVLLAEAAGASAGSTLLVGGYHGTFVSQPRGVVLSRPELTRHRLALGAGAIVALSPATCPIAEVEAVATYLAAESAGQCGPCVFGLPALAEDLRILRFGGDALGRLHRHLGVIPGRGACSHPNGTLRFVSSALTAFADDVALHADGKGCGRPYRHELPLPESLN